VRVGDGWRRISAAQSRDAEGLYARALLIIIIRW